MPLLRLTLLTRILSLFLTVTGSSLRVSLAGEAGTGTSLPGVRRWNEPSHEPYLKRNPGRRNHLSSPRFVVTDQAEDLYNPC